ncbi:hypothetical protein [Streptomyces sp. NPDC088847]
MLIYLVLLGGLGAAAVMPRLPNAERNVAAVFVLGVLVLAMWQWDTW